MKRAILLAAACCLIIGCSKAPPPQQAPAPAAPTVPPAESASPAGTAPGARETVNPTIAPPPRNVAVAANLPKLEAPAGFLPREEAMAKALATVSRPGQYGPLILTALRFDEANAMWEAEFTTDGRQPAAPRGHPLEHFSDDPVEQRRRAHSWVQVAEAITVALEGRTGEVVGGGFRGTAPMVDRPGLEHYRGRIITGGEVLQLQLTRADGSAYGRTLEVWVPQAALSGDLAFWQVWYGSGRMLDVWGLTARPGVVLAYKVAMPDPPPESVLQAPPGATGP